MIDDDHTMKNGDCPARYIKYSEGSLKKQLNIVDFAAKVKVSAGKLWRSNPGYSVFHYH